MVGDLGQIVRRVVLVGLDRVRTRVDHRGEPSGRIVVVAGCLPEGIGRPGQLIGSVVLADRSIAQRIGRLPWTAHPVGQEGGLVAERVGEEDRCALIEG